jgi:N-6 DNA Methylase
LIDQLERHYTRPHFARLLVDSISAERPARILDLGVGRGALLTQAAHRWPDAEYWAADVDPAAGLAIGNVPGSVTFVPSDLLVDGLPESVVDAIGGTIDVAVCNPPYSGRIRSQRHDELLRRMGMEDQHLPHVSTGPTVFLAQLMDCLRSGGELGVILPDTLIAGERFKPIRNWLIAEHGLQAVIELPSYAFSRTETRTYILLLKKNGRTAERVPLCLADRQGRIASTVTVRRDALRHRMDFTWHQWQSASTPSDHPTLADLGIAILRGTAEAKVLKSSRKAFVHTTTLPRIPSDIVLDENPGILSGLSARSGDILIGRVGTRCLGRRAVVVAGTAPVSDCVYVVRAPKLLQDSVWRAIASDEGLAWIIGQSRGVCARHLTKADLLRMPIAQQC